MGEWKRNNLRKKYKTSQRKPKYNKKIRCVLYGNLKDGFLRFKEMNKKIINFWWNFYSISFNYEFKISELFFCQTKCILYNGGRFFITSIRFLWQRL